MDEKKRNVGSWLVIAAVALVVAGLFTWQRTTESAASAQRVAEWTEALGGRPSRPITPDRTLPMALFAVGGFAGISGVIVLSSQTGQRR